MSARTAPEGVNPETGEIEDDDTDDLESPEPIDVEDDEPDDEPESPAEPSSLKVIDDMGKGLDAEDRRHRRALEKIMGDEFAAFDECPLCQVAGYAMQYPLGAVGPDQRAAVMTVLGEYGDERLREHPTEVRCTVCDGWGEMLNGSRNEAHRKSACQTCMGTGHVAKQEPSNVQPLWQPPAQPWQAPTPPIDYTQPNTDPWGRQLGHPHFNLDPASVGV